MHKRLFGLLASAAIVFTACSGNSTPAPAPASAPASQAPTAVATPAGSETPAASASAAGPDLTATDYFGKVTPAGKTGGTVVMAEWQSVAIFNPYYSNANTDFES